MAGENNKVVIVTGGSSGIGRCTASALKENGCIVYEFSRRNIPLKSIVKTIGAYCPALVGKRNYINTQEELFAAIGLKTIILGENDKNEGLRGKILS